MHAIYCKYIIYVSMNIQDFLNIYNRFHFPHSVLHKICIYKTVDEWIVRHFRRKRKTIFRLDEKNFLRDFLFQICGFLTSLALFLSLNTRRWKRKSRGSRSSLALWSKEIIEEMNIISDLHLEWGKRRFCWSSLASSIESNGLKGWTKEVQCRLTMN